VARKLNIELPISIDQRMAGAEKVGAHKTSMLQDFEAGRPLEIEAIVGAVVELGERLGVADAGDADGLRVREDAGFKSPAVKCAKGQPRKPEGHKDGTKKIATKHTKQQRSRNTRKRSHLR